MSDILLSAGGFVAWVVLAMAVAAAAEAAVRYELDRRGESDE